MFQNPSPTEIANILRSAKTIAVVGLRNDPGKASYAVSAEMQRRGYRIIPVNPHAEAVLGERSYARLSDIAEPIDIINVFRRSEALPDVVEEAVKTTAPVIWAQLGIFHEDAARIAADHGKTLVMDRCIKVDHSHYVQN